MKSLVFMVKRLVTCDAWVRLLSASEPDTALNSLPDSVSRSPLYSIYGEAITGVAIVRAFGASSKFMRDMLRCVDTVSPVIGRSLDLTHY
jgi:hypothetical protein